jgi:AcrR family transcriptional regulator
MPVRSTNPFSLRSLRETFKTSQPIRTSAGRTGREALNASIEKPGSPLDGPLTSPPVPPPEATGDSRHTANWQARREAIIDTTENDLGKGALYHYIRSKEELLAAIHDRVMDEVMLGADRVAAAGGSPSEQLAMLGDELLDVIHRYPDHVWVFLHEFPALTGERAAQFRERRREYERRVEAVLQAGVDSGEFRDLEPRLTAMAWLGMHNYTYLWLKTGGTLSARDVAKPFAEIFMRGIARPTG